MSSDPAKRARQLANLPNTRGEATDGSYKPGQPSPALRHGLRSRNPGPLVMGEAVQRILDALGPAVPRGRDGEIPERFAAAVQVVALQAVQVELCRHFIAAHGTSDERGRWRPENDALDRKLESYMRGLDRLGATPMSYAKLGYDVVRTADLATAMSDPDPARRAALMREAGVPIDGDGDGAR